MASSFSLADGGLINFGASNEIKLTHVHNVGLTLTHTANGDNLPIVLQLKSKEADIIADEVIASIEFAAGDSGGTDGATVAAGIHAIAEGTFSATANETKLVFTTGISETAASSAAAKMTLSSLGDLDINGALTNTSGVFSFSDNIITTRNDIYAKNIKTSHFHNNTWKQLGSDIDGEATGDQAAMVSLSANGKIVAVGSGVNAGGGTQRGHCRIYEFNENTIAWDQKGSDIDGEANSDISGNPVILSADGNTVGIGARFNDGINGGSRTNDGHVRIYRWRLFTQSDSDNSTYHHTSRTQDGSQTKPLIITANTSTAPSVGSYYWTQLGTDIDGADIYTSERFGKSVGLSANGNTFVGGGWYYSDGSVSYRGRVRIFDYDGSAWVKRGDDILGAVQEQAGYMVSISYDGNIVAIGSRLYINTGPNEDKNAGRVSIYYWNGSAWTQRGSYIDGEVAGDQEGLALSLSGDGNVIATGSVFHDGENGHARVFYWDGSAWTQRGINLEAEADDDRFGISLDISADGNTLLVGGYLNDDAGVNAGHARVFRWDGVTWNQIGSDIDGTAQNDQFGMFVNINGDGNILAIGGVIHDSSRGHVQIYTLGDYIHDLSVGTFVGVSVGTPEGGGMDASDAVSISVGEFNSEIVTTLFVNIGAGSILSSGTAGDVIGNDGVANAYITRITTAVNGVVYKGEIICLEAPAGGDTDINVCANSSGTIAEDAAGEGEHVLANCGVHTYGLRTVFDATVMTAGVGLVNDYIYLTHGTATAGTYNAGKFLIRFYGAKVTGL